MKTITWLSPQDEPEWFPPLEQALDEPAGLLAAGGDLSTTRLLAAYRRGIFPWYSPGQPVLWWSGEYHGKIPRRYAASRRVVERSPPAASSPEGSSSACSSGGNHSGSS